MFALIKTSATCLFFVLYMVGFYYRKPHVPIKSTRIFQWLIVAALFTSSFDLVTIYTVNHLDTVAGPLNLAAHVIYLLSILSLVYLLFLYLRSYLETEVRFTRTLKVFQSVPVVLSTAGILTLPITYVRGKTTNYSLGAKAYALYGSLVVYLLMILYYCLRYWKRLDGEKRLAIVLAVPLFAITAVIQMIIPETLVVVVCTTLILLGLILSNENVEKYVDEKTGLFNRYSFEKVLEEFDFDRQAPVLALLCFCRTENGLDWRQDVLLLRDICREIRQHRAQGYRVCENGVAFLGTAEEKAQAVLDKVREFVEDKYGGEGLTVETKVLTGEAVSAKYDCMRSIIAFCTEVGSRLAYVDYLTNIHNRNALERDLEKVQEQGNLSYLLADLNNLKVVNDTIGHSAGDRLLQDFARLLTDAVGVDGRAYRQGGDEFAILYGGDARQLVQDLERRCGEYNRSCAVPLSYAIGYCPLSEEGFRDVADQRMYEDKRKKKAAAAVRT